MAQPAAKVFTTAHDQPVADTHLAICASIAQLQASAQKMFEGLSICLDAQEERLKTLLKRLDRLAAQLGTLEGSHKVLHSSARARYPTTEAESAEQAFFRGLTFAAEEHRAPVRDSPPYFEQPPAVAGKDTLEIYHQFRRPGKEPNVSEKARPEDAAMQGACSYVSDLYPFDPSSYSAQAQTARRWGQGPQPLTLADAQEATQVEHLAASLYRLSTGSAAGEALGAEADSPRATGEQGQESVQQGQSQSPFSSRAQQPAGQSSQRQHQVAGAAHEGQQKAGLQRDNSMVASQDLQQSILHRRLSFSSQDLADSQRFDFDQGSNK